MLSDNAFFIYLSIMFQKTIIFELLQSYFLSPEARAGSCRNLRNIKLPQDLVCVWRLEVFGKTFIIIHRCSNRKLSKNIQGNTEGVKSIFDWTTGHYCMYIFELQTDIYIFNVWNINIKRSDLIFLFIFHYYLFIKKEINHSH